MLQCPRTAAVTFLGSLLSLPDGLMNAPMLQPYPHQYNTVSCPDLKVHFFQSFNIYYSVKFSLNVIIKTIKKVCKYYLINVPKNFVNEL